MSASWHRPSSSVTVRLCLAALVVSGCGQSGPAKRPAARHTSTTTPVKVSVCIPEARDALARSLAMPPSRISFAQSIGNNTSPQCSFKARIGKRRVDLIANVDSGPQPYFVLERTAIEAAQEFTATRMVAAPQAVTGLGIEADWFPSETQLMATDGLRLITVSVNWRGATQAHQRRVAEALIRTYLRHTKRRSSLAKGYP